MAVAATTVQAEVFQQVTVQEARADQEVVVAQAQEETPQAVLTKVHRADTQATAMVAATVNSVGPAVAAVEPVAVDNRHQEVITVAQVAQEEVQV